MSTRVRIDKLQLSGVDERTARAAMAELPRLLGRALHGRELIGLERPGLRVSPRGNTARDIARAILDALLGDQP
ncbi:MAG: hypothetical protein ABWX83_11790 [Luteibacter sp.]